MADCDATEQVTSGRALCSSVTWRTMRRAGSHARDGRGEGQQGPVVVGGVGGSGTRVVEEIMRRLNIYTGSDLNYRR